MQINYRRTDYIVSSDAVLRTVSFARAVTLGAEVWSGKCKKTTMMLVLLALTGLTATPVPAVDTTQIDRAKLIIKSYPTEEQLTKQQRDSSEALRELAKSVPELPFEYVELPVTMPASVSFRAGNPAFDKEGNIYATQSVGDAGTDAIVTIDRDGKFVRSFAKGLFIFPHSLRVDPKGNLWAVDAHLSVIYQFSPTGERLGEINVGERPDPRVFNSGTTDVTFGNNGNYYIADGYQNSRIVEYTADGKRLRAWGKRGSGSGEFIDPHGIATGLDGTIYVADRDNGRLQWFKPDGTCLGEKILGGWVITVRVAPKTGDVYVATHARGPDPVKDYRRFMESSYIFKLDPKSGKVLGKINYIAHQFDISQDGTLVLGAPRSPPGTTPSSAVLMFRPTQEAIKQQAAR